jgi:hypothetical protein
MNTGRVDEELIAALLVVCRIAIEATGVCDAP